MEQAKVDNYRSERGAVSYHRDHQRKLHRRLSDRLERRIFGRYLAAIPKCETILDLPSGFGRFFSLLSGHAHRVVEADVSETMLALNAKEHGYAAAGYLRCSALDIPFEDRSIDVVVSVRLNHHFDAELDREAHVREMMRVAGRAVIFTFFSFDSLKNRLRRLRSRFSPRRPKYTLRRQRVVEIAREHGFEVTRTAPLSRLSSGHIYALLERRP